MNQQLAILIMVDIDSAIADQTLDDHVYLFDNMRQKSSEFETTPKLLTVIKGTHWIDGSQASEQIINWLPYGIGSISPTVQRVVGDLCELHPTHIPKNSEFRDRQNNYLIHGGLNKFECSNDEESIPESHNSSPVITNITGEAVDKQIMYPARYGSPDLVTGGWYWSAAIDSSKPGMYSYIMHILVPRLVGTNQALFSQPVLMQCEAWIHVSSSPKVNGFTGGAIGLLPVI